VAVTMRLSLRPEIMSQLNRHSEYPEKLGIWMILAIRDFYLCWPFDTIVGWHGACAAADGIRLARLPP
jgi:hypothetical protein